MWLTITNMTKVQKSDHTSYDKNVEQWRLYTNDGNSDFFHTSLASFQVLLWMGNQLLPIKTSYQSSCLITAHWLKYNQFKIQVTSCKADERNPMTQNSTSKNILVLP